MMNDFREWAASHWRMHRWDMAGGFFLGAFLAVASWLTR